MWSLSADQQGISAPPAAHLRSGMESCDRIVDLWKKVFRTIISKKFTHCALYMPEAASMLAISAKLNNFFNKMLLYLVFIS